ncbi:MAG TPA: hypothetical protein DCK81_05685, partial [Clostridiales bacterium UBA9856]|nr:hypothetical protein [Clostridiales bacterium UBA9856]
MSLYEQWKEELENQTDETFEAFWSKYSSGETKIYSSILGEGNPVIQGNIKELAEKYEVDPVIFMGFLDGINTSLRTPLELGGLKDQDSITLDIDFEKLYFNMLQAKADYLYTLEEWNSILSEEKRQEITKAYKRSKTVVKEKKTGRNDPCPCGSGKKYK